MHGLADLIAQGSAHARLFVPSAILLGALHGLEPGHSKTMMTAFIVAVRGTVTVGAIAALSVRHATTLRMVKHGRPSHTLHFQSAYHRRRHLCRHPRPAGTIRACGGSRGHDTQPTQG